MRVAVRARGLLIPLAAILGLLLSGLLWAIHRPSPEAATRALFARIGAAVGSRDATAVIDELDRDYKVGALWSGEVSEAESLTGERHAGQEHEFARRGLALLMYQEGEGLRMSSDVSAVSVQGDGTILATVAIALSGNGDQRIVSPLPAHQFVLRWSGWWWPRLKVLSHDAIAVHR